MSTATHDLPLPIRAVPPARVHVMRGVAGGFGSELLGPVVGPLFDRLADRLIASGRWPTLPAVAVYEPNDQGDVHVTVSFTAPPDATLGPVEDQDFTVVELPPIAKAAIAVHHGHPRELDGAWAALHAAVTRQGWVKCGPARESYRSSIMVPFDQWVTELQLPVRRA